MINLSVFVTVFVVYSYFNMRTHMAVGTERT